MADEYRVHRDVDQLMRLLGGASGNTDTDARTKEAYVEDLNKERTPFVSSQVSTHSNKKTIVEFTPTPEDFCNKYDDCRSRNFKVLDPLVSVLSNIVTDDVLRQSLEKNAKERAIAGGYTLQPMLTQQTAPAALGVAAGSASNMTPDELDALKARLLNASGNRATYATSDVLRRVLKERNPRKLNTSIPELPVWLSDRLHMSLNFKHHNAFTEEVEPIDRMSMHEQEVAIIEDLLCLMEGLEGLYITSKRIKNPDDPLAIQKFVISPAVNTSLKDLTSRLLPVCSNFATVIRFVEEKSTFSFGTVNHALAAAMWNLIRDYFTLTAQLETQLNSGQLTLQKMWFYLQPTMRTFDLLASICRAVDKGDCRGGPVLSILHEKTTSMIGDAKAEELCLYLTQAACVPYFDMLQRWIFKGVISDPYGEFLVEENEDVEKTKMSEDFSDNYWKKRYTYCHDQCPKFLETVAEKTLRTGKYLNVIRNCGRDVICPHATELGYSLHSRQLTEQIEKAYEYASKLLLDLLLSEKALIARLKSLKHYFLLDRGDFIVQFMDMAEEEMRKNIDDIVPSRLENLMELALRTSTAKQDPFNEDLRVHLFPYDLITQLFQVLRISESSKEKDVDLEPIDKFDINLSGLEAFSFDYTVQWPLSLVVNKMVLTRYQMLFRHLFYSKYVERQLSAIWTSCKGSKILGVSAGASPWYITACTLRQRMIHFITNLEYYMMFEVLEPNWHVFEQQMQKVTNIDEVLEQHSKFLDSCMKDCLLSNSDLLRTVYKMMLICIQFSNFLLRMSKSTSLDYLHMSKASSFDGGDAAQGGSRVGDLLDYTKGIRARVVAAHHEQLTSSENFEKTITNFDKNFSEHLIDLLQQIYDVSIQRCEHKLMNIIYRLDFNGYYKSSLETRVSEKTKKQANEGPLSGPPSVPHHPTGSVLGPVSIKPTSKDIPEEVNDFSN